MQKRKIKIFGVLLSICISFEIYNIVPNKLAVIKGKEYNLPKLISGLKTPEDNKLKLFNVLPYKTVSVSVIPTTSVIPSGEAIGIKINVDGIMVLGCSDILAEDGKKLCPASVAGIKQGDVIEKINGNKVTSVDELEQEVNNFKNTVNLQIKRNQEEIEINMEPIKSAEDGYYKLGIWVKDSTTGIGTLTYIDPKTKKFGALGHAITDYDTEQIINLGSGYIMDSQIIGLTKSVKGVPGEIKGSLNYDETLGDIEKNTGLGVFGNLDNLPNAKQMEIATRNEVTLGKAYILSSLDSDKPEKYEVEITHISINSNDNKGMIVKVTDKKLLDKTGGIIQGMSGSPLIQNGKLIGAITHVFIKDPTRGYASFIELMLENQ